MTSETGYRHHQLGMISSTSVQIQNEDSDSSEDGFSGASQMGSSLTIKYKGGRSPLSTSTIRRCSTPGVSGFITCASNHHPASSIRDPSIVPLTSRADDHPSSSSSNSSSASSDSTRSSQLMASIDFKDKKLGLESDKDNMSGVNDNSAERTKKNSKTNGKRKEKNGIGRTVCLGLMGFLSVAVIAGVGLGALYFTSARSVLWNKPAQASSSLTAAENDLLVIKDAPCRNVSSSDYHSGLFTAGYDITRARPLHKRLFDTPARSALNEADLHECHLLNDQNNECQLSAQSKVIDSLSAYYEWIGDRLTLFDAGATSDPVSVNDDEAGVGSQSHAALSTSSHDRDLLAIQADLMSGFVVVVSSLSCPLWNVTRPQRPRLDVKFVQQLALMADEDAALELLEDFGTHYVEQAIIGGQAVILYSMDRKSVERLKAKNMSLSVQASTASLYLYSKSNEGVNFSEKSAELALDFLSFAKTQLFDDAKEASAPIFGSANDSQLIQSALKSNSFISLQMRPIEELFNQLPFNSAKFIDYWHRIRYVFCKRLLTPRASNCYSGNKNFNRTEMSHLGKTDDTRSVHVLPLISMGTNGTNTIYLRASWSRCMELCREDTLCSAITVCSGSSHHGPSVACPNEFGGFSCAIHRQQDFQYGTVTPGLTTLIPIRKDLRPVTLRGFTVHGQPLITSKHLADLASCARLCNRTPYCRIVSYNQHSAGQKSCRLYHNVTMNELRVQAHSTVLFFMGTFGPCFPNEETLDREICPSNAECSSLYGMCVCPAGFRKYETGCIAPDRMNDQVDEQVGKKMHNVKKHRSHPANSLPITSSTQSTPMSTESSTPTTTKENTTVANFPTPVRSTTPNTESTIAVHTRLQTAAAKPKSSSSTGKNASTESYYIRGVFITPETTTAFSKPTSTPYKPWQMRFGMMPPIGLSPKQASSSVDGSSGSSEMTSMKLVAHETSRQWNSRG